MEFAQSINGVCSMFDRFATFHFSIAEHTDQFIFDGNNEYLLHNTRLVKG